MTDIDQLLARIGRLPLDPRLGGIDAAVFAGLADATRPVAPRAALAAIAGFATGIGVLATVSESPPGRHVELYQLGMPGALAPSTLLADGQ